MYALFLWGKTAPPHTAPQRFLCSFRGLIVCHLCSWNTLIKTLIITSLAVFWLLSYNSVKFCSENAPKCSISRTPLLIFGVFLISTLSPLRNPRYARDRSFSAAGPRVWMLYLQNSDMTSALDSLGANWSRICLSRTLNHGALWHIDFVRLRNILTYLLTYLLTYAPAFKYNVLHFVANKVALLSVGNCRWFRHASITLVVCVGLTMVWIYHGRI